MILKHLLDSPAIWASLYRHYPHHKGINKEKQKKDSADTSTVTALIFLTFINTVTKKGLSDGTTAGWGKRRGVMCMGPAQSRVKPHHIPSPTGEWEIHLNCWHWTLWTRQGNISDFSLSGYIHLTPVLLSAEAWNP